MTVDFFHPGRLVCKTFRRTDSDQHSWPAHQHWHAARLRYRLRRRVDSARPAARFATAVQGTDGSARALLGIAISLLLMLSLPVDTWIRLLVWLAIGMVFYWTYG
jgi:hypothetical protein